MNKNLSIVPNKLGDLVRQYCDIGQRSPRLHTIQILERNIGKNPRATRVYLLPDPHSNVTSDD